MVYLLLEHYRWYAGLLLVTLLIDHSLSNPLKEFKHEIECRQAQMSSEECIAAGKKYFPQKLTRKGVKYATYRLEIHMEFYLSISSD